MWRFAVVVARSTGRSSRAQLVATTRRFAVALVVWFVVVVVVCSIAGTRTTRTPNLSTGSTTLFVCTPRIVVVVVVAQSTWRVGQRIGFCARTIVDVVDGLARSPNRRCNLLATAVGSSSPVSIAIRALSTFERLA